MSQLGLGHFWAPKHLDTGYLVNATLPIVYLDLFETLQMVFSRSEDVHDI